MFNIPLFIKTWIPTEDLKRLLLARGLRSLTQGYIFVVFAIYLSQIGFPAWLIGITLAIGSAASAILTLATGILSDRIGRKPFLLAYSVLLAVSGAVFGMTSAPVVLILVSAMGGIGRSGGAGGQAGPFAPAETALLSDKTTIATRTRVFAANNMFGTLMQAVGAAFAGAPELMGRLFGLPVIDAYRLIFWGVAIIGAVTFVILLPVTDTVNRGRADDRSSVAAAAARAERSRDSVSRIWKFSIAGFINGFGLGFVTGILSYWLYIRFRVSPESIGLVISASLILASIFSLWMVRLAEQFGHVEVITASRLFGAVCTVLLGLSPIYPVAAIFVILRAAGAMSAMPVRQSYSMGVIDPSLRGAASGVSGVARRIPAAVSPAISGYWLGAGDLELPFFAAAAFMVINAGLYFFWFRNIKPRDVPAE